MHIFLIVQNLDGTDAKRCDITVDTSIPAKPQTKVHDVES